MIENLRNRILTYCKEELSPKRFGHVLSVAEEAKKLAVIYQASPEDAELAALFHDCCRDWSLEQMNRAVLEWDLDQRLLNRPQLSHSKIAAELMRRTYQITQSDLINAVRYHTTGREGMTKLEKIIYLADAIEPHRSFPGVENIRKLALEDLDQACLYAMEHTISYLESRCQDLDQETIRARDDLKRQLATKINHTETENIKRRIQ